MSKKNASLKELVERFSQNDVIEEMEKEYQRVASVNIELSLINDNRYIQKVSITNEVMNRITKSISETGLWNPLVVRPVKNHYELILGRKRYYGAKKLRIDKVPCVIADVSDEETLLMLLADARDQKYGNVVEMAYIYKALSSQFGYRQSTLAQLSHESRSQVTNTMRLLNLPDDILTKLSKGKLTYGHAKAILSLSQDRMHEVVDLIEKDHLSVRDAEKLASKYKSDEDLATISQKLGLNSKILISEESHSLTFTFKTKKEKEAFKKIIEREYEEISK